MIRYASEVTIARPPKVVIDALLDPDRYAEWTPMTDVEFDGSGRPGVGTTGRFRMAEGPIKGLLRMEIVELDPDREVVIHVTHPALDWTSRSTAVADGAGTRFTYAGELRLKGWRRLLEPIMAGEVRRGEASEAVRLKALLEADPVPVAASSTSA